MFTCVIEEDMGQIIEQCTLETTKQPVKLYFGKPKLGLCYFSPPQYCRAASKDKSQPFKTKLLRSRFTVYGNKVCLLAMLFCDRCYWRKKKNTTALKDYSCDNVILCLDMSHGSLPELSCYANISVFCNRLLLDRLIFQMRSQMKRFT